MLDLLFGLIKWLLKAVFAFSLAIVALFACYIGFAWLDAKENGTTIEDELRRNQIKDSVMRSRETRVRQYQIIDSIYEAQSRKKDTIGW